LLLFSGFCSALYILFYLFSVTPRVFLSPTGSNGLFGDGFSDTPPPPPPPPWWNQLPFFIFGVLPSPAPLPLPAISVVFALPSAPPPPPSSCLPSLPRTPFVGPRLQNLLPLGELVFSSFLLFPHILPPPPCPFFRKRPCGFFPSFWCFIALALLQTRLIRFRRESFPPFRCLTFAFSSPPQYIPLSLPPLFHVFLLGLVRKIFPEPPPLLGFIFRCLFYSYHGSFFTQLPPSPFFPSSIFLFLPVFSPPF